MKLRKQPLASLCSRTTSGGTPSTLNASLYGGDIPWLRTQEVNFNFITDTEVKITEAGLEKSSAKWIPENSVIVALYGNSAGRVALTKIALTTNQACGNFVVDPLKADYRFIYYHLLKDYEILHGMAKGAAQNNLNLGMVKDYQLLTPDLRTQQRIGDILFAYDELMENNRRRMTLLEESARLLFREWFVRLRFPRHERSAKNMPETWERRSLGQCAKFLSGGTPSKAKPEFWDGDIPWVSSGELTAMRIHDTSLHVTEEGVNDGSRMVPAGTTLVVVRGMSLAKEFRMALTSRPVSFNQDLKGLIAEPDVDPLFLFHALETQRDEIRDRATEASHGTKKLDTAVLTGVQIPFLRRAFSRTSGTSSSRSTHSGIISVSRTKNSSQPATTCCRDL